MVSSTAFAADAPVLRVSRGDPFAGCLVGGNGSALSYRSAEVEPWIADNPARTANLIGTWQQDRWSDGGAKGQVASWSFDGGRTWGETPQPFTECAQPFYKTKVLQYQRTSDPWVSFGPDGTAYAVSLPFDGDFIRNGLGAAVSHDGGRTWVRQQDIDPLVARSDTGDPTDDKQSVTADPRRVGYAYAVWDQLQDVFGPCPTAAAARTAVRLGHDFHRQARAAAPTAPAQSCPIAFTGPAFFSRTTDGGKTWEKARAIVPTAPNTQTIGNQIVANRQTGTLYDFFNFIDADGTNNIEMVSSTDQGTTWSARQYVQRLFSTAETRSLPKMCACGVVYPGDVTKPLRTGDIIPEVAIDPNNGQLYVIWQDGRPNGFKNDMLLASTSTGGGLAGTWSAPVLVNPPTDKAAFTPAIAVDRRGRLGVLYYDLTPPLTSPDILLTDTWFTTTSGPGLGFGERQQLGAAYNMEAAPVARGFFVGDYEGLAARVPALHRPGEAVTADEGGG
ncbi:MAG: glycoside hydrolase, partial [Chloroflexota bacterium]|nr:glycoside hydrolase [Chloroflexota bacterium]